MKLSVLMSLAAPFCILVVGTSSISAVNAFTPTVNPLQTATRHRSLHHRWTSSSTPLPMKLFAQKERVSDSTVISSQESVKEKSSSSPIAVDGMPPLLEEFEATSDASSSSFSYGEFARQNPFANNILIATTKTAAADLLAQTVISQTPITDVDWQRSLLFCLFGATYLGGFQYLYQVNIFKKLFDVDKFTSQPWADKIKDGPGLQALAAQTALDLGVLTLIYLPTFYIFKAGVFSGSLDPSVWVDTGISSYQNNFSKDEFDLVRVWLPADLVCFSVPLYLRLPVRHIVSFVWTAYLSFARGGH
uniref:Uncharacterized protein n=1 Tax=Ditylum brightwellii TaxID=49249 RepID=A0A7S2EHN9_9STRA|mmetsp:Transcript_30530/g.45488  ORF Transcript_30530/g.45488 Transcript_30530/m.45488 type:complete len:304 (+) Transcript_30530:79-990(+)